MAPSVGIALFAFTDHERSMGAVSCKAIKTDAELRGVRAEFRGEEIYSVPPSALIRWPHGKPGIGIEFEDQIRHYSEKLRANPA